MSRKEELQKKDKKSFESLLLLSEFFFTVKWSVTYKNIQSFVKVWSSFGSNCWTYTCRAVNGCGQAGEWHSLASFNKDFVIRKGEAWPETSARLTAQGEKFREGISLH